MTRRTLLLFGLAVLIACKRSASPSNEMETEDRQLDAQRKPAELVAFADIKPGMKVADLAAGGGYTTEVLARAVGPSGVVYGMNSPLLLDFAGKDWTERLARPANAKVVKVTRELDDPLPAEATDLDAVVMVLFYHDLVWVGTDRAKMNANILKALKPGGKYVIVDHSGRPGTGTTEGKTLHRIEESVVRDEVTKAGFKLAGEAAFLKNPNDTRDWNAAPGPAGAKRGTSDRFVLAFTKP